MTLLVPYALLSLEAAVGREGPETRLEVRLGVRGVADGAAETSERGLLVARADLLVDMWT